MVYSLYSLIKGFWKVWEPSLRRYIARLPCPRVHVRSPGSATFWVQILITLASPLAQKL